VVVQVYIGGVGGWTLTPPPVTGVLANLSSRISTSGGCVYMIYIYKRYIRTRVAQSIYIRIYVYVRSSPRDHQKDILTGGKRTAAEGGGTQTDECVCEWRFVMFSRAAAAAARTQYINCSGHTGFSVRFSPKALTVKRGSTGSWRKYSARRYSEMCSVGILHTHTYMVICNTCVLYVYIKRFLVYMT
jgi:hypothetical protein